MPKSNIVYSRVRVFRCGKVGAVRMVFTKAAAELIARIDNARANTPGSRYLAGFDKSRCLAKLANCGRARTVHFRINTQRALSTDDPTCRVQVT